MSDRITAPFTPDQVERLDQYQRAGYMHPFTCVNRGDENHRDEGLLVPTVRGWICPYCDYTQNWAHAFMAREPQKPMYSLDEQERK